jgi:hypothetical protein
LHCAVAPAGGGLDPAEVLPADAAAEGVAFVVGAVGTWAEPGPGTLAGGGVAAGADVDEEDAELEAGF